MTNRLLKLFLQSLILILTICFPSSHSNKCVPHQQLGNNVEVTPNSVRWAIVVLAKPKKIQDINTRNRILYEKLLPFKGKHDITLLFFSEKIFPQNAINNWMKSFDGLAKVEVINTADKGFSHSRNDWERYGYKYMCKFFTVDMYDYLRDKFDYYLRCDSDCYLNTVKYDLLQWTIDNRVQFGYLIRKKEAHRPTVDSLPSFTQQYMNKCKVTATSLMEKPLNFCFNFYNNFHIGSVSFFNRPDVRHYLVAANASGGITDFRWGDSTIQAYAVRLFIDPRRLVQIPNITYLHGSHDAIVSTFGDGKETNVPQILPNWKFEG